MKTSAILKSPEAIADRAAGCIVGAFIGDALGLGPHWYYDLAELRQDFGDWIDDYVAPRPDAQYHRGMDAGELSQTGIIMLLLLRSVVDRGGYDESDFTQRLDSELLPHLNGQPFAGPGGYTNHSFRQVWEARVRDGKPWGQTGGNADTSESAERVTILAAVHALQPGVAAQNAFDCTLLSQNDSLVVQQSVGFSCILSAIVRGEPFDEDLADKLLALRKSGEIPTFNFGSPDALFLSSWIVEAAHDPGIRIEPPWKVSLVYGMSCAINFMLPAAYYLAARFPDDFESAVLHAINGGGQNMSRACLTGALVGAQIGLSQIPLRFIDGLIQGGEIAELARKAGELAAESARHHAVA